MSVERFALTTAQLWGGLLIWAAYFLISYVVVALACERDFAAVRVAGIALVPFVSGVGLVTALAATGALVLAARRRSRAARADGARFADLLAWTLGLLALLAIVWTGLPHLLLPTGCA